MNQNLWINIKHRAGPAAIFVGLVAASLILSVMAIASIGDRRATVAAAEDMLARLQGRSLLTRKEDGSPLTDAPTGSPFVQGQTVNVAGAALLQRIVTAVTRVGGNVLSSQVDLQKADAKDGWIGLVVSCEVDQPALQNLLYDVEAGMPFLYIEQLVVNAPVTGSSNGRMKVLLSVSGQWLGNK